VPIFSILDLSPIPQGSSAADALRASRDLAQHAEAWGYHRYWLAEHHNMPGIASAATAVVIGYIAAATSTMRIGAGGIMLPNHAALVIAEQFGTLASLYPGRIDLGLGRAPGSDQLTALALGRDLHSAGDAFPDQVSELQGYFASPTPGQRLRAVPGAGIDVPLWLLGSSLFSARLAAQRGLPFAFAGHFAPRDLHEALAIYRSGFRPSAHLAQPYVMVGVNALAAESDDHARWLFTSQQQAFVNLGRGTPTQVPPPSADLARGWTPEERQAAAGRLTSAVVGSPTTVEQGLRRILAATQADELILTGHLYDPAERLRSYELLARIRLAMES
jgi:luciferase family oxidoreductase group 1